MTLWNKVLYLLAASVLAVFFSTSIFSATTHKGTVGEDGTEIEVTRVFYSSPTYPRNAIRLGREGYVLIEFDVDTDGAVLDPYVIESEPTGVFELRDSYDFRPRAEDIAGSSSTLADVDQITGNSFNSPIIFIIESLMFKNILF